MQQILLTAQFEKSASMEIQEDPWGNAVKSLCELAREYVGSESVQGDAVISVIAHTMIVLLYSGKVNDNCYDSYAEVLTWYIKSLTTYGIVFIRAAKLTIGTTSLLHLLFTEKGANPILLE